MKRNTIRTERTLCPHCDQFLTLKTFKAHKRRYYDVSTNTWFYKKSHQESPLDDDSPPSTSFLPPPDLSPAHENCHELPSLSLDQMEIDAGHLHHSRSKSVS